MEIPHDPVILLSFVNAKLRDHYSSLEDLCKSLDASYDTIITTLAQIDYHYNPNDNQFH